MSILLGLLFNRYVFLICVILIFVALVGAGKLVWNRYTIGGLLALALGIGAWTGIEKWAASIRATERALVIAEYNAKIKAQNEAAAKLLAAETGRADAATNQLKFALKLQENTDEINGKTIDILAAKVVAARNAAGRLRDPNAAGGQGSCGTQGQGNATTQGGAGDAAQEGGLFSAGATQLLTRLTHEADEINRAYISCRADSINLRLALQLQGEGL